MKHQDHISINRSEPSRFLKKFDFCKISSRRAGSALIPEIMRLASWFLGLALTGLMLSRADALDPSDPVAAEGELRELVAEWEAVWQQAPEAESATSLALSLQALGIIQRQLSKTSEALDHLRRAEKLLEAHGPEHLPDLREALALTLQDDGQLAAAEARLREVAAGRRQADDPAALATTLDHLALSLLYQGKYPRVAPLLEEALALTPEDDTAQRARLLGHLGRLKHTLGSHARAAAYFRDALALEPGDPRLVLALESQLALARLRLGDLEAATRGTEAVAERARELFAGRPLEAVPYLNNLGGLSLAVGNPAEARAAFAEAVEILRDRLGPGHPSLMTPTHNLGVALQQLGDYAAAGEVLGAAAALQAEHLPPIHLRVAETRRHLARNALLAGQPDAREKVVAATDLGLALLEKLVAEGTETERLNFLARFDPLSLPCATGDAEAIADSLIATKARLLDAMLDRPTAPRAPGWRRIQASLPPGGAFVDTCRFRSLDPDSPARYGAVLLLPDGPPRWIPLGDETALTDWLDALRERLAWVAAETAGDPHSPPPALKLATILKALHADFWQPVGNHLPPETRHLAFSADGALHFLPLAALLDGAGTPLCHRFPQLTGVTSARSLLNDRPLSPLDARPWTVVTITDFPTPESPTAETPLLDLLGALPPMPGTREEARRIRAFAPENSVFLADRAATESALRAPGRPPGVLHLGCHGFFLGSVARSPADAVTDFDNRSDLLHSSGLVLYRGALRRLDSPLLDPGDDLLFPAEIARLPLDETRLVTLSSCDSGSGTALAGEGLLGLRRSFALAGAREVAVALWPVSDRSTPAFMDRFYRLALASGRTGQALWQTQSEFIPTPADPGFEAAVLRFGPFTLTQDAPLAGGREIDLPPSAAESPGRLHRLPLITAAAVLIFLLARFLPHKRSAAGPEGSARGKRVFENPRKSGNPEHEKRAD
jgi:CHAT domain-containing protein/tetratricopeptide (TPR) repeat protein